MRVTQTADVLLCEARALLSLSPAATEDTLALWTQASTRCAVEAVAAADVAAEINRLMQADALPNPSEQRDLFIHAKSAGEVRALLAHAEAAGQRAHWTTLATAVRAYARAGDLDSAATLYATRLQSAFPLNIVAVHCGMKGWRKDHVAREAQARKAAAEGKADAAPAPLFTKEQIADAVYATDPFPALEIWRGSKQASASASPAVAAIARLVEAKLGLTAAKLEDVKKPQ
jgi:hypothetical protein